MNADWTHIEKAGRQHSKTVSGMEASREEKTTKTKGHTKKWHKERYKSREIHMERFGERATKMIWGSFVCGLCSATGGWGATGIDKGRNPSASLGLKIQDRIMPVTSRSFGFLLVLRSSWTIMKYPFTGRRLYKPREMMVNLLTFSIVS